MRISNCWCYYSAQGERQLCVPWKLKTKPIPKKGQFIRFLTVGGDSVMLSLLVTMTNYCRDSGALLEVSVIIVTPTGIVPSLEAFSSHLLGEVYISE